MTPPNFILPPYEDKFASTYAWPTDRLVENTPINLNHVTGFRKHTVSLKLEAGEVTKATPLYLIDFSIVGTSTRYFWSFKNEKERDAWFEAITNRFHTYLDVSESWKDPDPIDTLEGIAGMENPCLEVPLPPFAAKYLEEIDKDEEESSETESEETVPEPEPKGPEIVKDKKGYRADFH